MEGIVNWECKACILIMENVSSKIKVKLYITSLNSHYPLKQTHHKI
jgi:hypothetical protein